MKAVQDTSLERGAAPAVSQRLVVGTVPHDFSMDADRVLGPWCFFKAEDRFPDWDRVAFVDPFSTSDLRDAGGRAASALTAVLIDEMYAEMNQRHGTQYSRAFWRCVLSDWIIYLVMLSWRIWRHVEVFIETAGPEPFRVPLMEATGRFQFADSLDFVECCTHHSQFRYWLVHETVRRLAPKDWVMETSQRITPAPVLPAAVPRRLRWPVEPLGDKVFYGSRIAALWRAVLSIYVSMLPKRPQRVVTENRASVPKDMTGRYLAFVKELMAATMPETLRSGFAALDAEARRHGYRKGRLYLLSINPHDDLSNVILGHAMTAGERVVDLQHGGVYGWSAVDWLHATNEYFHDTFASWGFTEHGDYSGRFVPLPSPMLSSIASAPRNPSGEIVMVGAFMYGLPPRFDCFPTMMAYRRAKLPFLGALAEEVMERLRYRQYPSEHTFSDLEWLRRHFPKLRPVGPEPLIESLSRSTLVLLDHPQTTICQTMAGNIPTIAYWDWNAWPLARQAVPFFEELERVGVLFRTPEAAAAQVNAVWRNAREWWNELERQRARLLWCSQFALHKRYCWLSWLKRLPAI